MVEILKISDQAAKPRRKMLITCRHHCCEMMANYMVEGILEEALMNSSFRKMYEVSAVPFADKDGVMDGDQGKNRRPRDHARDYGDNPIYPA